MATYYYELDQTSSFLRDNLNINVLDTRVWNALMSYFWANTSEARDLQRVTDGEIKIRNIGVVGRGKIQEAIDLFGKPSRPLRTYIVTKTRLSDGSVQRHSESWPT